MTDLRPGDQVRMPVSTDPDATIIRGKVFYRNFSPHADEVVVAWGNGTATWVKISKLTRISPLEQLAETSE